MPCDQCENILQMIEDELDEYEEWSPKWQAVYNLLGKVNTEVRREA